METELNESNQQLNMEHFSSSPMSEASQMNGDQGTYIVPMGDKQVGLLGQTTASTHSWTRLHPVADPGGGGAQEARSPFYFSPNTLKSPLPFLQILDPPLLHPSNVGMMLGQRRRCRVNWHALLVSIH